LGLLSSQESCAQVGQENYAECAKAECLRFIQLLRKTFGEEPEGARLAIKRFDHDFGSYYEVVCWYYEENEASVEYAYKLEAETPEHWEVK
jgi:hypothetical protein